MNELELLEGRLSELCQKSFERDVFTFSDFLGLMEQTVLKKATKGFPASHVTLFGGAEGCERVMARFGNPDALGWEEPFPIVCLKIAPKSQKFADDLTHRDFLGALMHLGFRREMLGDIAIFENVGYLFAEEKMAEHILASLTEVKRTAVTVTVAEDIPTGDLFRTETVTIQVQSERLDAVIAKVFSLSREDAQGYFAKSLVFVNGAVTESTSHVPKVGDKISVRTKGRFIYGGAVSLSKKGKTNVRIEKYV
jgi:RNA-binding protein YlmH